jgi:transposase
MAEHRQTSTTAGTQAAGRVVTAQRSGMADAARNLGMHAKRRRRGTRALPGRPHGACPGQGPVAPAQAALHRLRVEGQRLRMEREIFKKALGFFANPARCRAAFLTPAATPWPVSGRWAVLAVSRRGCYASGQRHARVRAQEAAGAFLARGTAMAAHAAPAGADRQSALRGHRAEWAGPGV